MVDFAKLMDPEERANSRAHWDEVSLEQEKKSLKQRDQIELCMENDHCMSHEHSSFVRSVRHAFVQHRVLSEKQEKFLNDIHARLVNAPVVMSVTHGMRGYFAVCYQAHGEEAGPINTGIGSYRTKEGAFDEAHEWAKSEGIPIVLSRWGLQNEEKLAVLRQSAASEPAKQEPPAPVNEAEKNGSESPAKSSRRVTFRR
jgi:hypothetical protein